MPDVHFLHAGHSVIIINVLFWHIWMSFLGVRQPVIQTGPFKRRNKNAIVMKKILEVLQYGNGEIRFNTDIDVTRNPGQIIEIASMAAFSMATKLWGGNEQSVLAVLRALGMADLSLCEHRKEMIREIEYNAQIVADCMKETMRELEKNGARVMTFASNIMPPKMKS